MEKRKAISDSEKLHKVIAGLPDFAANLFYFGSQNRSEHTKLSYALDLKFFFEYAVNSSPCFFGKTVKELVINDLKLLTSEDIDSFVKWMKNSRHLSEKTLARRRTSVSVLFEYLINSERKLDYNPVLGSSSITISPPGEVSYLTLEEQAVLLDCIQNGTGLTGRQLAYHEKYKHRDIAIVFLFLDTGLRISELHSLDVDDIVIFDNPYHPENTECYVRVPRNGNNISRVYFSDESKDYLKNYLDMRESGGEIFTDGTPLFVTLDGSRLSIREIQQMLKKYVNASLDRNDISVNRLRSSFAMEFYKHEKNILLLQQRMGHKSLAATNVYARAGDKETAQRDSRNWRITLTQNK